LNNNCFAIVLSPLLAFIGSLDPSIPKFKVMCGFNPLNAAIDYRIPKKFQKSQALSSISAVKFYARFTWQLLSIFSSSAAVSSQLAAAAFFSRLSGFVVPTRAVVTPF